jgi:hypothetical protein
MKSLLRKIVLAVLLLPIVLILISLFLPSRFQVEREVVIRAQPAEIFPWINELQRWPEWTPWNTNREPSLAYQMTGPASGPGAMQSWTARSGNGSIKLLTADPATGVTYELNFNDGRFISRGQIRLEPASPGTNDTRVTWTNTGDLGWNPVGRYLGLLMERMMGADLDVGLGNLKSRLELK